MTRVYIRNGAYEAGIIGPIIHEMLDGCGPDWIKAGSRVVIKPNMLLAASPEKGIVTHPLIVRLTAQYLLEKGARVQISDSPPVGSFQKLARLCGYEQALADLDVELKPFTDSVRVDVGAPFGPIEIARDALEADALINLAKLKSHAQMVLTLGVKNLFGTIVGLRKPEWHMRVGIDRDMFARLLVLVCQAVAPDFTLVDGILALEGQGPGKGGQPRHLGLLLGGANVHAVDQTICSLLAVDPDRLMTHRVARAPGLFDGRVDLDGEWQCIDDFRLPALHTLSMGPERLNRFMRRHVIQRPVVADQRCKLCGECWNICPAHVISQEGGVIQFDYDRCIRCYCCLEVCPHGAISAKEPLLGGLRRRLML